MTFANCPSFCPKCTFFHLFKLNLHAGSGKTGSLFDGSDYPFFSQQSKYHNTSVYYILLDRHNTNMYLSNILARSRSRLFHIWKTLWYTNAHGTQGIHRKLLDLIKLWYLRFQTFFCEREKRPDFKLLPKTIIAQICMWIHRIFLNISYFIS